jgi:hypothetical protein
MGMSAAIADEEHAEITKLLNDGNEVEARGMLVQIFMNRGYIDGDSYMPSNHCWGCRDNPNDEEFNLM